MSTCGNVARFIITALAGDVAARARPRAGASPSAPRRERGCRRASTSWRCLFGHLDADRAARPGIGARMRTSGDAIAYAMSLCEARDAVDLHAGRELELVAGDGRADGHADEAGRRRRARRAPPRAPGRPPRRAAGRPPARSCEQQAQRRQLPGPLLGSGTERDLELLDDGLRFVVAIVVVGSVLVVDRDIQLSRCRPRRRPHQPRSRPPLRRRRSARPRR